MHTQLILRHPLREVDASFKHGVLSLSIPKTAPSKATKVEVRGE